jgi:hypothetical protein
LTSPTLPLPEDLNGVVDAYLNKHEKANEGDADKLQTELLSIYHKYVQDDASKHAGFVAVLSALLGAIRSRARILQWWDLMEDRIAGRLSTEKGLMAESFAALLNLLSVDHIEDEDGRAESSPNPFVDRLILDWMDRHHQHQNEDTSDHLDRAVRESLVFYGKRRPREFLEVVDRYFVKKENRVRAATLLCEFIENKPPHLYEVLQTPLFGNLLRCLQLDTSTTVVSMALTTLIMFLPHMPSSLVSHLPVLFNIYARLLFWQRERAESVEISGEESVRRHLISPAGWELCEFVPNADGDTVPHLLNYFTILYGLYPINFMDYIRKPQRYLRHANAPNPDTIEVQPTEIRHRSEQFRRGHLLHPNFYSLTLESEKTDHGRFQTSEPADLVAECMALCTISDVPVEGTQPPDAAPAAHDAFAADESPDGDHTLLSSSATAAQSNRDNWRLTHSTDSGSSSRVLSMVQRQSTQSRDAPNRDSVDARPGGGGGDSPTLPPHLVLSTSHTQLQDMINSNKAIKSGLHQSLANDSVPSLSLSRQDSVPERPPSFASPSIQQRAVSSPVSTTDATSQLAQLRSQVLLLQNDLSFERYLKQQHMAHIGEIRRRQVKEAASEAETQNLLMANRLLKSRFEEAKQAEMQIRKESELSRARAKKWEADLQFKLKNVREELKKTKSERETLQRELEGAKQNCEKLKKRVCEAEVRELKWQQNAQSQDMDDAEIERLKAEVERLVLVERDFQAKETEMKEALAFAEDADSKLASLRTRLDARDRELQQATKLYETQAVVLQSKLSETKETRATKQTAPMSPALESALAASRAKQLETQKQYSLLMRKYTVLLSSLQDMKPDPGMARPRLGSSWSDDEGGGLGTTGPISPSSPPQVRNHPHRVISNPEEFDAASSSFNATPPLDTGHVQGQPSLGSPPGPSTPVALTGSSSMGSLTTDSQLYYGRGTTLAIVVDTRC